ncbi:MAG: hypothetical protein HKL85_01870 [Acidimicrobiaceae bacterium]|nr:hypothetical protein [Acidimicrobiaceae bacterium]
MTGPWICDMCGGEIDNAGVVRGEDPGKGYVIWQEDAGVARNFKIIHQGRCDNDQFELSVALDRFLGDDGLAYLLSFLSLGPVILRGAPEMRNNPRVADLDEFVDLIRRLHTPGYEQSRRHYRDDTVLDDLEGANEAFPYSSDGIRAVLDSVEDQDLP